MATEKLKRNVLQLLHDNARIPGQEIAERLGISPEQADAVVASLEKEGLVMGYRALVNTEYMKENEVRAVIEVEVQPERDGGFDRVARAISKFDKVVSVFLISGRYDLRLEVVGDSLEEVASFVSSKLAPMTGIKSTVTHFLLKKYKDAGVILEKDEEYERLKISP